MRETVVAKGIFSKLTITLNDGVNDELAYMKPENNPLAQVKDELEAIIKKFERAYFEAVNKADTQGTDLPSERLKPASGDLDAPSGAGEKGRL